MRRLGLLFVLAAAMQAGAESHGPDGAPGALGKEDPDVPILIACPASEGRNVGTAVIACRRQVNLAVQHEGADVARWPDISSRVLRFLGVS